VSQARKTDGCSADARPRHRGKVVTVAIDDNQFRILHDGTQLSAHSTTFIKEFTGAPQAGTSPTRSSTGTARCQQPLRPEPLKSGLATREFLD
jgi:hypothetical protein